MIKQNIALTVDVVALSMDGEEPRTVLLIKRKNPPFQDHWALPGGFVDPGESPETAARRELQEETRLKVKDIRQIGTYGEPDRDPRGQTVSVAFVAPVTGEPKVAAADDASDVGWFDLANLPPLAFDHDRIIADGLKAQTETYRYAYPHPAVTTDIVIFSIRKDELNVLLIKRDIAPFKGKWALPGGFVRLDESLEQCATRELAEETGVKNVYLEQLYSFGAPKRDPRERVITVAYFALIPSGKIDLKPTTDAADAQWFPVSDLPALSFDHDQILDVARERLTAKLDYSNIVFQFLPKEFTLSQVQSIYEIIQGTEIDKRNFRKWLDSHFTLKDTGKMQRGGAHRPAKLFSHVGGKGVETFN